jgi:hypothetical protein
MLPDFPEIKGELHFLINQRFRQRVKEGDPVLSLGREQFQHEGMAHRYSTVQGTAHDVDYAAAEVAISLTREEIRDLPFPKILERVDRAAEEMCGQMARTIYATLDKTLTEQGRSISSEGKPFSFETFLKSLESLDIDFDPETGKPYMPSMIMAPDTWESIRQRIPQWEADPDNQKKVDEIMERKRQEWHARESNRQLVD